MAKCNKIVLVTTFACLPGILQAATAVSDTFDAGIGGWGPNTTETTVGHSVTGGNPGGSMRTDNLSSASTFNVIGATYRRQLFRCFH